MSHKISDQVLLDKTSEGSLRGKLTQILLLMPPSGLIHLLPIASVKQGAHIETGCQVLHLCLFLKMISILVVKPICQFFRWGEIAAFLIISLIVLTSFS